MFNCIKRPASIALALLALNLAGCSFLQYQPVEAIRAENNTNPAWVAQQKRLEQLGGRHLQGKIALRSHGKGGQAKLRWLQTQNSESIDLSGPLGGGRVTLTVENGVATFNSAKGEQHSEADAERLLEQKLGWPLPLNKLRFWAAGLPSQQGLSYELDEQHRLAKLNDGIWQIRFKRYQSINDHQGRAIDVPELIDINALPGNLSLYDDKGDYLGDELFVRVLIKQWTLVP